ncbi:MULTISPECIES: GMP reductase [Chromobacterium]|uniref:GMP reductase n=1 Tax=Chromobacterium aquaticum TaxID=467180 RepID=A0ABV8ZTV3_9NEIS|nr:MULTISPECIES: GMP reductase [Chromobacterium]KMN32267.1 guanosine 5'-monophosphate oxidoreductase [Chromobacterium sp. LK1]MCD5362604.1 GMP reductase [Chromobacterium aquaticum]
MIKTELNYGDVYLVPKKTVVDSRKECDTSVQFGPRRFDMPIYPSNMKSVVSADTCEFFARQGWFYTMHRFNVDAVEFTRDMQAKGLFASISVGVNEDTLEQLAALKQAGLTPEYMTLDIANAWCVKAERMIKHIKQHFPDTFLIGGNIATAEAARDLQSWGCDAIKAGIAGGRVCITKNKTGFHRPMISTVQDCVAAVSVPVIADGGIVEHGDMAKAMACGASMIMAGSLFAGYDESAGDIVEINGKHYKEYFGSASQFNKGAYVNVEGKKILVEYKGSIGKLLCELKEDLQSSISYAGGKELQALRSAEMIQVRR